MLEPSDFIAFRLPENDHGRIAWGTVRKRKHRNVQIVLESAVDRPLRSISASTRDKVKRGEWFVAMRRFEEVLDLVIYHDAQLLCAALSLDYLTEPIKQILGEPFYNQARAQLLNQSPPPMGDHADVLDKTPQQFTRHVASLLCSIMRAAQKQPMLSQPTALIIETVRAIASKISAQPEEENDPILVKAVREDLKAWLKTQPDHTQGTLMAPYDQLLRTLWERAEPRALSEATNPTGEINARTGEPVERMFSQHLRFDLRRGFPAVTAKFLAFKTMQRELAWFFRGDISTEYLDKHGVKIWKEWTDYDKNPNGWVGELYPRLWRNFGSLHTRFKGEGGVDQLKYVVDTLRTDPTSRRILISAWDPKTSTDPECAALSPCHVLVQFTSTANNYTGLRDLNCAVTMRSSDVFLGLPFNISSYALLTHIIARLTGHDVGELAMHLVDAHLYLNHWNAAKTYLDNVWMSWEQNPVQIKLNDDIQSLDDLTEVFPLAELVEYIPGPKIPAPVAV